MDVTVWAQELVDQIRWHMDSERDVLTRYGELAAEAPDEHVRFLMNLILQDEIRHHQLFAEMADRLRSEIEQRGDTGLPELTHSGHADLLKQQTAELLAVEREDIKELKRLRKELRKVADTEWWAVLVDVMESDNRKHIRLLEFIRDHA